jgi:alkanesulfonate monooxygenase SsuD/methylene tetrahydromethanopterin reductase-like flavin-dependent oxidoreductase (luciferase family)
MRAPRIGVSLTSAFVEAAAPGTASMVRAAADAELDFLQVGDHVSFHDGLGFDGLIHATAALATHDRLPTRVGLYLLALRHPVGVARQLADMARLFPVRL